MRVLTRMSLKVAYGLAFLLVLLSLSAVAQPLPTRQGTSAAQRAEGEFARLVTIPTVCQTARERERERRRDCPAIQSCVSTMSSQVAAGVEYLKNNPAVLDALRNQARTDRCSIYGSFDFRLQALAKRLQQWARPLESRPTSLSPPSDMYCGSVWYDLGTISLPCFESYSAAGHALLAKVRGEYTPVELEYRELIAFNDRYTGVEALERAYARYRQALEHDDIAGMIRERLAVLQGLEQARARKQLLTQQSAQMAQYEQTLTDFGTAIDREGLRRFADQQTQTAVGELRSELARLSQTAPGKRGDISANLKIFATRMQDIDSAIRSARSIKIKAEHTRQKLVEGEGAARRVMDAAASEELKGAFDEAFISSTNELINRFHELGSSDLWRIHTGQEDVDAAMGKLLDLENRVSDARARYEGAKRLDGVRQATMQKTAHALSELAQPEIRSKLGNDGLAMIASLKSFQDTLSRFDSVRLIDRPDYSNALAATDDALVKTEQLKAEILQVAQLAKDLKELNRRIDRRGRQLIDGPTSSRLADISKSVNILSAAKIPLSSQSRLQLADVRAALSGVEGSIDDIMDREETRILSREMPSRSGVWRFSVDRDKITDEERVQAFARVESSQAKYDLTCRIWYSICRTVSDDDVASP